MKKLYKQLTREQKAKNVIFSSELVGDGMTQTVHEVTADQPDKWEVIARLKDDKFFNDSPFKYNLIRQ